MNVKSLQEIYQNLIFSFFTRFNIWVLFSIIELFNIIDFENTIVIGIEFVVYLSNQLFSHWVQYSTDVYDQFIVI